MVNHLSSNFEELDSLVKNGIEATLPGGNTEKFNEIVFLVADLGFIKEICSKCSSVETFGCYQCKKKITNWHSKQYQLPLLKLVVTFGQ